MKGDLSVPKQFEEYSKALFNKKTITQRGFIELCLLAANLIDTHWDQRQGMAYHIAATEKEVHERWQKLKELIQDNLQSPEKVSKQLEYSIFN